MNISSPEAKFCPIPAKAGLIHVPLRGEDCDEAIETYREIAAGCIGFWDALRRSPSIIPPSVLPALLNKDSRDTMQRASNRIWRDFRWNTEIQFVLNHVRFAEPLGYIPWEISLYLYNNDFGIWGPMLVSMGHRIMADPEGDTYAKKGILGLSLLELQKDQAEGKYLIAISVPKRPPTSFTHHVFTKDYRGKCIDTSPTSSRYYLAGANTQPDELQAATEDPRLHEALNIVAAAWSENYSREMARRQRSDGVNPINTTTQFVVDALLGRKTTSEVNREVGLQSGL